MLCAENCWPAGEAGCQQCLQGSGVTGLVQASLQLTLGSLSAPGPGLAWGPAASSDLLPGGGKAPRWMGIGVLVCQDEVGLVAGQEACLSITWWTSTVHSAIAALVTCRCPAGRRRQLCLLCSPSTHPRTCHIYRSPLRTYYEFVPTMYQVSQVYI